MPAVAGRLRGRRQDAPSPALQRLTCRQAWRHARLPMCSIFTSENQMIVEDFLKLFCEFRLVPFICSPNGTSNDGMNRNADCDARRRRGRRSYILPCLNLAASIAEIKRRPMAVKPSQPNSNVGTCKSAMKDSMPRRMRDGTDPDMKSSIFSAIYCR